MPKLKTRKAVAKRFKITKTKKIRKRKCGQDHFNARESSKTTMKKRRNTGVSPADKKNIKKMIPYS